MLNLDDTFTDKYDEAVHAACISSFQHRMHHIVVNNDKMFTVRCPKCNFVLILENIDSKWMFTKDKCISRHECPAFSMKR